MKTTRLLTAVLLACALVPAHAKPTRAAGKPRAFTIAPVVEGILLCADAAVDRSLRGTFEARSHCGEHRYDAAAALAHALDLIEPGGAAGNVQVGYTLPVPLLGLYRQQADGRWELDNARIDRVLDVIRSVRRPVVVYLLGDHFDTQGALTDSVLKDPQNLMQLADGTPPIADYFGNRIAPYTLLPDADLPVNRYRLGAVRAVAQRLAGLEGSVRQRIVAVTLAGELHHLFRNFESGMGEHQALEGTDYAPRSAAGFRQWLAQRYGSIDAFNRRHGFSYTGFDAVPLPAKDIRRQPLKGFAEHYDSSAAGTLAVGGWLWDPQRKVESLELFVNGRPAGPIERGLNRLDVYRALKAVDNPNIGFRRDQPFDQLPPGLHVGQVVATVAGEPYQLGRFEFRVVPRDQAAVRATKPCERSLPPLSRVGGVRAYLDLPRNGQDVYFNPLARDWNAYRDSQPRALLMAFYEAARAGGLPAGLLYSHQIVPQANSSWNPQLFASDSALDPKAPWKPGINLYGGSTDSEWVARWLSTRGMRDYGVPEFNPQQWKRPGLHAAALQRHRQAGARFVSPYYMSITSPLRIEGAPALKAMEVRPDNRAEGSDQFYRAIRDMARQ